MDPVNHEGSEMETFLPNKAVHGSKDNYKVSIVPARKETETLQLGAIDAKHYDPFKERNNPNPTTDAETFTHILKAALGSGILSMPYAFKCAGLSVGLLSTVITAFVCTYCSYILVKCAHSLYHRARIPQMTYADVAEVSFTNGPQSFRKWGKAARVCVMWALFITYFGAISCYTVIAGQNFKQVIEEYTGVERDITIYVLATLPPLLLLCFIPNLKALAPFSLAANVLIIGGLGITVYYLVSGMSKPWDVRQTPLSLSELPNTFCITVFAMEAIGLMMPLENNMKTPKHFLGPFGVLSSGMSVVSMIYILIGVVGFLKYGDLTQANISAGLPIKEIPGQLAKLLIGTSVLLTYVLQYFVCLDILWSAVKDRFAKREKMYNGLIRMALVGCSVSLAVAVPDIGPFVSLIGALCFSFLGILFPIIIEIVTYWEKISAVKLLLRNSLILLFGVMALCVGTYTSINDIIALYVKDEGVAKATNTSAS